MNKLLREEKDERKKKLMRENEKNSNKPKREIKSIKNYKINSMLNRKKKNCTKKKSIPTRYKQTDRQTDRWC